MKKTRAIIFFVIGIVAISLSVRCFTFDCQRTVERSIRDIDHGIYRIRVQNFEETAEMIKFGFGSILLVSGLSFVAFGISDYNRFIT